MVMFIISCTSRLRILTADLLHLARGYTVMALWIGVLIRSYLL
jgi:hypothetical protein